MLKSIVYVSVTVLFCGHCHLVFWFVCVVLSKKHNDLFIVLNWLEPKKKQNSLRLSDLERTMSAKAKDKIMKVRDRDEDDESLSSPCFQIDPNVELKDIPTTGDEYLLKVMKERQSCLVVTKCNEDFSKFAKNQSCFVKEVNKGPCHDQTFI